MPHLLLYTFSIFRELENNLFSHKAHEKSECDFFLRHSKMRAGLTKPSSCLSKETRARHAWAHLPTNATLRPKTRATARQRALAAITFSEIWMFKTKRDLKSTCLVLYLGSKILEIDPSVIFVHWFFCIIKKRKNDGNWIYNKIIKYSSQKTIFQ